jgi:hypothetical protein
MRATSRAPNWATGAVITAVVIAIGACASAPKPIPLGEYTALQPAYTTPPKEPTPSKVTVSLAEPAYVALMFVVPGRGSVVVYPSDSGTYNHLDAGQHDVALRFPESVPTRDSLRAIMQRGQRGGGTRRPPTSRDTTRGPFVARDASPSSSPLGYLLLVASPDNLVFSMLKRRVEGVTIPIEDDEALSTVMKLVKASLPDRARLAGWAAELDRQRETDK